LRYPETLELLFTSPETGDPRTFEEISSLILSLPELLGTGINYKKK